MNWARANAGIGVYASTSAFNLMRGGGYAASVPVLIGEAEDTSAALTELPIRYQQAVMLFWQFEGARPLCWLARRCGQGVDYRTYEARVIKGHELLRAEIALQHERIEAYKVAVSRLKYC